MTMTTTVRINHPLPPKAVLDFLTTLVGGDPATVERLERPSYHDDGSVTLANRIGLGLAALCDVQWHPDGPLSTRSKWHEPEEEDWPPACVEVSFDTSYGFGRGMGYTCGDLHRWILERICGWLSEAGVSLDHAWWSAGEYGDTPNQLGGFNGPLSDLSTHEGVAGRIPSGFPTSDEGQVTS